MSLVMWVAIAGDAALDPAGAPILRPVLLNADGEPMLRIVATTTQLADLARNVGGQFARVDAILSANVDPHHYTLGRGDLQRIAFADVLLENGVGLEDEWLRPLMQGDPRGIPIVVTSRGFRLLPGHGVHPGRGDGVVIIPVAASDRGVKLLPGGPESPQGDPHIWFAVPNAQVMVANIRDALAAAAPPYAQAFKANAARYVHRLDALDREIAKRIAALPPARRTLVTDYGGLRYYATRYGLGFVRIALPTPATAEPSTAEITQVVAVVRNQRVPAIFLASASPQAVAQLGRAGGVRVVTDLYEDALGLPGSEADTYITMMRHDTGVIVSALQ